MNRQQKKDPTEIASEIMKQDIKQLLSSQSSYDMKDFQRIYSALFKVQKPVAQTSRDRTDRILENCPIPYISPQLSYKKAGYYRSAAQRHSNIPYLAVLAQKETEKEVYIAKQRLLNKKMQIQIEQNLNKVLEQKIVKINSESQAQISLYQKLNEIQAIKEEEQKVKHEKLQQIKEKQKQALQQIKEKILEEKYQESQKIKMLSENNKLMIKLHNEELFAENAKKRQEIVNQRLNSQEQQFSGRCSPILSVRSRSEDQRQKAYQKMQEHKQVLISLREEELDVQDNLFIEKKNRARIKSELGLLSYKSAPSQKSQNKHFSQLSSPRPSQSSLTKDSI